MVFDFIEDAGLGAGFVYKNNYVAYYWNGTTFAQIIDLDYPAETVRGIVYLDGTYYVMTPAGAIYGSAINGATSWSALNVIQSQAEPDGGVCLARQLNLLVAFNSYSTEFFYDAANATGSPLLPYTSAFLEIGCACPESVTRIENDLMFMSQGRQKGRSIQLMKGTVPAVISTPYIDRILDGDSLEGVTATYIKLDGHGLYLLTLPDSGYTLVYDFLSGVWGIWTQLKPGNSSTDISAPVWANGALRWTVTKPLSVKDGDYVTITGSSPSTFDYSGYINVIDDTTIEVPMATNPGTYVGSSTIVYYFEEYFGVSDYVHVSGADIIQDSSTGILYALNSGNYLDGTQPIKYSIRTPLLDGGDSLYKQFPRLEVVGDKTDETLLIRYTNNDYVTYSSFRPIELSLTRSRLNRLGRLSRRAFEVVSYENQPTRLAYLEITASKGSA